jgi:hypothetical protein
MAVGVREVAPNSPAPKPSPAGAVSSPAPHRGGSSGVRPRSRKVGRSATAPGPELAQRQVHVVREVPKPEQRQRRAVHLVEARPPAPRGLPSQGAVEAPRPCQVAHAQGDQGDALLGQGMVAGHGGLPSFRIVTPPSSAASQYCARRPAPQRARAPSRHEGLQPQPADLVVERARRPGRDAPPPRRGGGGAPSVRLDGAGIGEDQRHEERLLLARGAVARGHALGGPDRLQVGAVGPEEAAPRRHVAPAAPLEALRVELLGGRQRVLGAGDGEGRGGEGGLGQPCASTRRATVASRLRATAVPAWAIWLSSAAYQCASREPSLRRRLRSRIAFS